MKSTSTAQAEAIKETVRDFLSELVTPKEMHSLSDTTPLITGGVLDSITLVELVATLEDRYGVTIHSHEMSVEYFDSLNDIADMVQSKLDDSA